MGQGIIKSRASRATRAMDDSGCATKVDHFFVMFFTGQNYKTKADFMASNVIHLTDENFDKVIGSSIPVLVDFWAEWCGPCRMIAPLLDELSNEYEGKVVIAKVNVEEYPDLASRFGIQSIPNLKIFKKGVEVGNIVGAVPKNTLKAALDKQI